MSVVCIHICVNDGSKDFFGEQHGKMIVVERACLSCRARSIQLLL
jgi:hypothetical protein